MMFLQGELPPLDSVPVDINITIYRTGDVYKMYILSNAPNSRVITITIKLTPNDLYAYNGQLREAIQRVASTFNAGASYVMALANLAETGNYIFKRIFQQEEEQQAIHRLLQTNAIIQVVSDDFFIPWELLYDGPLDANAHISYYWGMRHIISRVIAQDARKGAFVDPTPVEKRPRIGLVTNNTLPYVEKYEVPKFEELHKKKTILLNVLRKLSMQQRSESLAEIKSFLSQDVHVIHFACHARGDNEYIDKSFLLLTENFELSMSDYVTRQLEMTYSPFIVLNACLTGEVSPLHTSSWARRFWELGARGVLAADFSIPDWFGASFSDVLYQYLLNGMPIGKALLDSRRTFWEQQHNLMGLAYALYAPPSIQLVQAEIKKAVKGKSA